MSGNNNLSSSYSLTSLFLESFNNSTWIVPIYFGGEIAPKDVYLYPESTQRPENLTIWAEIKRPWIIDPLEFTQTEAVK